MDTSKEYILMCKKAKEIQKLRTPKDGDFALFDDEITIIYNCGIGTWSRGYTWLPRQDQLQEMVTLLFCSVGGECFLLDYFYTFYKSLKEKIKGMSMEQLWLAFVMKEKYQKTWNGKDWEKNV